uniref:Uncharacterized protein n=1 Tax=Tanacetum cinerariifolium TaxID=118510 RepID=A0A699HZJ5_TANCI|nr:hypothetical protein [Tanacetum cinerariifolium]
MLEILSRRFFLKLNLSDHRSILTDLQGTLKGKWRYLILAKPPIHNHVLIPNYQDFKVQDFCYSDGFECFQAIKIGSPPDINHCCYECGDPLDGIFCKRCTCKSCGKDTHIGYNFPPKISVISNPEPCNNQTIDEHPQALPSFHPTFQSEAESPFTLDSTPTHVDESPNVFNPPPQPFVYPCEFCGNDSYYGHYCTPPTPFIYPEQCYNQDFNFPQDF